MRFTDEHRAFRLVRDVVDDEIAPHVDEWERDGTLPADDLFPKLGDLGLLGVEDDPDYGGQGADHLYSVILAEQLHRSGCAGIPMAIGVQTMMATASLHEFGSDDLKRRHLAPALWGGAVCSIAVTEPGAGSDVAGLRTRAVRGDHWIINGSKPYSTNGTQADWLCLLARASDEGGYRGISGRQADRRPADARGGRPLPAVPRRHGLHRGDVDLPVLPRHPPGLHRRRRRRGHAAGAGEDGRVHGMTVTAGALLQQLFGCFAASSGAGREPLR